MLKHVLHDWSDKYASKILKPLLLPHIKSESRLLLFDSVLPHREAPLPPTMRRMLASADLHMLCSFSAPERNLDQWKALIGQVDPGLKVTYISNVPGSIHNFIEDKYSD